MQESTNEIKARVVLGAAGLALVAGFAGGFALARASARAATEPTPTRAEQPREARQRRDVRYKIPVTDSQPQRGPNDALVTVIEWCDMRGAACRAADTAMQELLRQYDGRLRWVYRHLIDATRFAESHRIHALARGALHYNDPESAKKFWEVRARLLATSEGAAPGDAELRRIAEQAGVDYDAVQRGIEQKLYAGNLGVDTVFAKRFGVTESPSLFINGRPLGSVPARKLKAALQEMIETELVEANRLLEQGVARGAIYETLTRDGLWGVNDDPAKRQTAARGSAEH